MKNIFCSLAFYFVLIIVPAEADQPRYGSETPRDIADRLRECLIANDQGQTWQSCVSIFSDPCQTAHSNYNWCIGTEAKAWTLLIQEEFQMTLAASAIDDKDDLGHRKRAEHLCQAQKLWSEYKTAQCSYEYSKGGTGSIRITYGAMCSLGMNSKRAISLRAARIGPRGNFSDASHRRFATVSADDFMNEFGLWCDQEKGEQK